MKILSFELKLIEPLLATAPGGDPNSETSSDFIPGSVLRGALIARYASMPGISSSNLDAGDPAFARLFLDGTTRYLNGYPVKDTRRTIPTPLSWQRVKGDVERAYDLAINEPTDDEQFEPINLPFCQLQVEDDQFEAATLVHPSHTTTVHTSRDRRYGRARSNSGAVYQYESLEAGQSFRAAILCEDDPDARQLQELLGERLQLGGSRSGGYGWVQILKPKIHDWDNWREFELTRYEFAPRRISITLLSDVILRNSIGQYTVAAETAGEKISQVFGGGIRLRHLPERTFIRGTLIGGFNRKWGLPLTQTPAMRMGSVIVFEIEDGDAPTDDQMAQLELQGIGERRAEGFGRLGVNIHGNDNFSITDKITERSPPVSIIDPESVKIAQRIVIRLLRRNLNETVARRANQLGIHITGPSKSQLSRLRLIIREALGKSPTGGREILDSYLNSIEKRVVTRSQFTRNRVDNRTTIDWLRHRFNDESGEEFKDSGSLPKLGSNITASLTPELIYEYNLRLVDAVLMRAAKNRGVN